MWGLLSPHTETVEHAAHSGVQRPVDTLLAYRLCTGTAPSRGFTGYSARYAYIRNNNKR